MTDAARPCGHPSCGLDVRGPCCRCADRRSLDTRYQVYVDGAGLVGGHRWSFYCDKCRLACQAELSASSTLHPATGSGEQGSAQLPGDAADVANADADADADAERARIAGVTRSRAARRQRQLQNLQRVFGTREDVQQEEYESPLTSMFTRAWGRFQQRQEERRLDLEHQGEGEREAQLESDVRGLHANPVGDVTTTQSTLPLIMREQMQVFNEQMDELTRRIARLERVDDYGVHGGSTTTLLRSEDSPVPFSREHSPAPLDVDMRAVRAIAVERPAPLESEALLLPSECKVCMCQIADTLTLPCAHLALCEWCARACIHLDGPRRQRRDRCPVCRLKGRLPCASQPLLHDRRTDRLCSDPDRQGLPRLIDCSYA